MKMTAKICGECGGKRLRAFAGETFAVAGGVELQDLAGLRCADCGEVYLDSASQNRYVAAGNAWVLACRQEEQALLVRVRRKLKLTQRQAAQLTGGGHNAFSRYERGQVRPMPAVVNLFKLLDKHPGLIDEVRSA